MRYRVQPSGLGGEVAIPCSKSHTIRALVCALLAEGESVIGSPLDSSTLVGPLVDEQAFTAFGAAFEQAQSDGGELVTGGPRSASEGGFSVHPAIIDMPKQTEIDKAETFAPTLKWMISPS